MKHRFGKYFYTLFALAIAVLIAMPALMSAAGEPSIASDKDDYAPGALVILSGENW